MSDLVETPSQEDSMFKPQIMNPDFSGTSAFSADRRNGRPIPQDRGMQDTIDDVDNPNYYSSMRSDAVIKLPKFSSRSHNYFF